MQVQEFSKTQQGGKRGAFARYRLPDQGGKPARRGVNTVRHAS